MKETSFQLKQGCSSQQSREVSETAVKFMTVCLKSSKKERNHLRRT